MAATHGAVDYVEPLVIDTSAQLDRCQTNYEIFLFTESLCRQYGFEYFAVLTLPEDKDHKLSSHFIIGNWPPEMVADYERIVRVGPRVFDTRNATRGVRHDREKITKL